MVKIDALLRILLLPYDKALHALYGLVVYSLIVLYNPLIAIIVVITIAAIKEIYDGMSNKHTKDVNDFLATIIVPSILYLLGGVYV